MVRGPHGSLLGADTLEEVGEFSFAYRSIHMLFTLVPLSKARHDISEVIDEQVRQAGGEAVVDLAVTAHHNNWTESLRVYRRFHSLRGWSHGKKQQVSPRGPRAGCPDGVRARG
jgi:hypothetical protein